MEPQNPRLKILHVLTLNGPNGEYGGPVRVARELCAELNRRGHQTHIISGARKNSEPIAAKGLKESFVHVKPLSQKFPVSSLWSWKLLRDLSKEIRKANLVHIHFARDLIPILAALLSILTRTPFVTQTHGMIIFDGRWSTKITDLLLTRPILNQSKTNLVLTGKEWEELNQLDTKVNFKILPNGIFVGGSPPASTKSGNRIVFCARLDKRKGVDKFIQIAQSFENSNLNFEIYGPDGGELSLVLKALEKMGSSGNLKYKGSIKSEHVQDLLGKADLLVLPSKDEPFPMVVLEALAVGTPVLVMPSCGFAKTLSEFHSTFVSQSEDTEGLINTIKMILQKNDPKSSTSIQDFCRTQFSIEVVCSNLEKIYDLSFSKSFRGIR